MTVGSQHVGVRAVSIWLLCIRLIAAACVVWTIVWLTVDLPLMSIPVAVIVGALLASSSLRWAFLFLVKDPEPVPPLPGLRVAVVTTFVPNAEPLEMLERTLLAIKNLDYAHDTWVLDEGNDKGVASLCSRLGIFHFSRLFKPQYQMESGVFQRDTKHGNFNSWLHEIGFSRYDIFAGIDPDHIPRSDFLTACLGYFRDPRVAYVQSPQEYYNAPDSLIARGCDEESRDFYWITQRAYNRFQTPSLIGAHNIHRMSALKSMGGLAPHVADDLLLTLKYHLAGWRGVYVARVLARGLAPVDWTTYIKQQRRWARSLLDVKVRLYPRMTADLKIRTRFVGFLQGFTYLQDALIALCFLVTMFVALIVGIPLEWLENVTAPNVLLSVAVLALTGLYPHYLHPPHVSRGLYWRSAWLRFAKWPFTLYAAWQVIQGNNHGYDLTNKSGVHTASKLLFLPHLVISGFLVCAAIVGLVRGTSTTVVPHVCAAAFVVASLGLAISSMRTPGAGLSQEKTQ